MCRDCQFLADASPDAVVTPHQPLMENDKQGLLRSKMESGQGTNPALKSEDPLTVDGIMMGDQVGFIS